MNESYVIDGYKDIDDTNRLEVFITLADFDCKWGV